MCNIRLQRSDLTFIPLTAGKVEKEAVLCCSQSQNPSGSHNYLVFCGCPSLLILAVNKLDPN